MENSFVAVLEMYFCVRPQKIFPYVLKRTHPKSLTRSQLLIKEEGENEEETNTRIQEMELSVLNLARGR